LPRARFDRQCGLRDHAGAAAGDIAVSASANRRI
jgi:hypothetical protein